MKHLTYGINGPIERDNALGTVVAGVGDAANKTWETIQAWQGKEAPSSLGYEVQKKISETVKGALGADNKATMGAFTEAERARSITRGLKRGL